MRSMTSVATLRLASGLINVPKLNEHWQIVWTAMNLQYTKISFIMLSGDIYVIPSFKLSDERSKVCIARVSEGTGCNRS